MFLKVIKDGFVPIDMLSIKLVSPKTRILLSYSKHYYEAITISEADSIINQTMSWPFDIKNSVTGKPNHLTDGEDNEGRYAIWNIGKLMTGDFVCGNEHQLQISVDKCGLTKGTYVYQDNIWLKKIKQ